MRRPDSPAEDPTAPLKVAFRGAPSATVRASVHGTGVEVVDDVKTAEVVHLTVEAAAVADTVEGLLGDARAVVLHVTPVQLDPTVIRELADRADAAGVVVAVAFVHRYYPMVRLARRRVRSGTPGPLHLLHGWSTPDGVPAWCDVVEFVSRHRINRLQSSTVDPASPDPAEGFEESSGAMGLLFETDRGAVGTLAASRTRPVEGGTLLTAFDGAEESIVFHEGRPEVLDVMGRRATQRFQRGVGADVSRYSTLPMGHPQGHRDCWDSFVADAHAAARGATPDGLPTLVDLARGASLAAAIHESQTTSTWTGVGDVDLGLVNSTEGKTA